MPIRAKVKRDEPGAAAVIKMTCTVDEAERLVRLACGMEGAADPISPGERDELRELLERVMYLRKGAKNG